MAAFLSALKVPATQSADLRKIHGMVGPLRASRGGPFGSSHSGQRIRSSHYLHRNFTAKVRIIKQNKKERNTMIVCPGDAALR